MQPLTTATVCEPHRHHHHYILGHIHEQFRTSERYFLDQVGDRSKTVKRNKHKSDMDMVWFGQIRHSPGYIFDILVFLFLDLSGSLSVTAFLNMLNIRCALR